MAAASFVVRVLCRGLIGDWLIRVHSPATVTDSRMRCPNLAICFGQRSPLVGTLIEIDAVKDVFLVKFGNVIGVSYQEFKLRLL